MHASAYDAILPLPRPGSRVLDVDSRSGYLTHVLAELVRPHGEVVGVDHIQPLVDLARRNMQKSEGAGHCWVVGRAVRQGGGMLGFEVAAPYDAIHMGLPRWSIVRLS